MIKRHERDLVFARLQSEMSFLAKPNMPAEEVNNKPKRRLLDFDESDEESNEEDPMKAELIYVKMFFIVSFLSYRFKNEPSVDKDKDPLGLWKTKRLKYPTLTRLVKKFICVPATSMQAEWVFSWMGWLLNKRRLCLSGESVNSQTLLEGTLD